MSTAKDLRARAWESLRTRYWNAFAASFVFTIISGIGASLNSIDDFIRNIIEFIEKNGIADVAKITLILHMVLLGIYLLNITISVFVTGPLTVGFSRFFMKNTEEMPEISELFWGFKNQYIRNVKTVFITTIKIFLWTLLFIVPGIIKGIEYSLITYVLADHPEFTSKEASDYTRNMMKGKKGDLFILNLSFIGWILLSILTLGIGSIFLTPYMEAATAEFYMEAKNIMTE